ncbi:hypothetical protein [Streptomyces sp. NPDC000410]|uniref:hypothetical protein n=1 Tax=Streptomyces sp. NPDC000410 TaxID=3154254 RepID=UPI0033220246
MALAPGRPLTPPAPSRRPDTGHDVRCTPVWQLVALGVVSSAFIAAACWVSGHVHADATLQMAARFLHVAALVVGLGSVLAVDWFAVMWLLGRLGLPTVLRTACTLQVPIWLGLGGLVVSGLFLRPNLDSPLTLLKLGLVLAVAVNGLYAHRLGQRLEPYLDTTPPRRLLVQSAVAATVSQTGWWGATFIGFLNSQS